MEALSDLNFQSLSSTEYLNINGGWNLLNLAADLSYLEAACCAAVGVLCPPVAVLSAVAVIAWTVDGVALNTAAGLYDNRK